MHKLEYRRRTMMVCRLSLSFLATTIAVLFAKIASAAPCESLASLKLLQTTVTAAEIVRAGEFLPPGEPPTGSTRDAYRGLPEFCRVQGVIQPSSDSNIEIVHGSFGETVIALTSSLCHGTSSFHSLLLRTLPVGGTQHAEYSTAGSCQSRLFCRVTDKFHEHLSIP